MALPSGVNEGSLASIPNVLKPAPPSTAELIEVYIDAFRSMGTSEEQLRADRLRFESDSAFFDEWVVRIHEWHVDPLAHLQEMRDSGRMALALGPDLELE